MRFKPKCFSKLSIKRKRKLFVFSTIIFCLFICSVYIYNSIFPKNGADILKAEAKEDISITLSEIVEKYLSLNEKLTGQILTPHYDKDGKVISYSVNSASLEKVRSDITTETAAKLKGKSNFHADVPIGTLLSSNYFSGKGINIALNSNLICSVTSEVFSEIESVGINQAYYRAYIVIKTDCKLITGDVCESFGLETRYILSEKLIIGDVPLT